MAHNHGGMYIWESGETEPEFWGSRELGQADRRYRNQREFELNVQNT